MRTNYPSIPAIRALCAGAILGLTPTASAISIFTGFEGGSGDVDNVLFDQDLDSGPVVRGSFNSNPGFLIDFTSTTGDLDITGSAGAARIEGLTEGTANPNDPFTNLSFELTDGSTFTKAQLNVVVDETATNGITFSVFYFIGASPYVETFDVTGSGQNQFTILADGSERITSVSFDTTVAIDDVRQVRIGGFAQATSVPDSGTTVALLGLSLLGLGGIRRKVGDSRA